MSRGIFGDSRIDGSTVIGISHEIIKSFEMCIRDRFITYLKSLLPPTIKPMAFLSLPSTESEPRVITIGDTY